MSLILTISNDLKAAMKSGDAFRRDTLRLLQSALKNAAIDAHKALNDLSESEVQRVIKKLVKQRTDSMEQYRAGNRLDLAEKEEAERTLLLQYLPTPLSHAAIESLVDETMKKLGPLTPKDIGRVMGMVMQQVNGQADGTLVRQIVENRLRSI